MKLIKKEESKEGEKEKVCKFIFGSQNTCKNAFSIINHINNTFFNIYKWVVLLVTINIL